MKSKTTKSVRPARIPTVWPVPAKPQSDAALKADLTFDDWVEVGYLMGIGYTEPQAVSIVKASR